MDEHRMYEHRSQCWMKYLGVIVATLIGSFLAFYFAVGCAINHFISHAYTMKQIHRMERSDFRDLSRNEKSFDKDFKNMNGMGFFQRKNAIDFIKTPDSYKFIVDLTPFQGNADAINVEVNGNNISIVGESSVSNNNSETFTKMSQTYSLGKGSKPDKMYKKKVGDKYIITVPIED